MGNSDFSAISVGIDGLFQIGRNCGMAYILKRCIREELIRLGYPLKQFRPIWNGWTMNFMRSIVLEFEPGLVNYRHTFKLQGAFERAGKGKTDYENQLDTTPGPHAWVACEEDTVYTMKETTYRMVPNDDKVMGMLTLTKIRFRRTLA